MNWTIPLVGVLLLVGVVIAALWDCHHEDKREGAALGFLLFESGASVSDVYRGAGLFRNPGAALRTLKQLEQRGLVSSFPLGSSTTYSLTVAGRDEALTRAREL